MSEAMTLTPAAYEPAGVRTPKKAALASWIGSAVEYHDFFIYGTAAALVFPRIFFSSSDPQTAAIAAFATFGVAYIARPFGAVALGHVGDRFGRRKVLIFTLLLMGISTFMIGLLPTYGQVGIMAPILLVIARLLQGISAAGEQAGANSMTLEHAPPDQRAFYTSFTLSGTQAGLILATFVFLPISQLPEDQLLSWGWRIPFFLSAVVVAVGMWVRRSLPETPAFEEEEKTHTQAKLPVATLFQEHAADVVRVIFAALVSVVSTIFSVFTLSYAVNTMHIGRPAMLTVLVLSNVVALAAIPAWAMLADRIGRKPVFILGALGLGRADLAVHLVDQPGRYDHDLRVRRAAVRRRLQCGQRHLAGPVWRDVRHQGPPVRHGDRHADRLRPRRLRPRDQRRHHGHRPERLGARGESSPRPRRSSPRSP